MTQTTIKATRLMYIEMAAQRLGMTSVADARERVGYIPPSLEEDMEQVNLHVFGNPNHKESAVEYE
jgi:hypothetical protein